MSANVRSKPLAAGCSDIGVAHIVDENQNDVGLCWAGGFSFGTVGLAGKEQNCGRQRGDS